MNRHDIWLRKTNPKFKLGATVRLRAQSGEIVEGRVVHLWEDKSVLTVRFVAGNLVYNVPTRVLIDEREPKWHCHAWFQLRT